MNLQKVNGEWCLLQYGQVLPWVPIGMKQFKQAHQVLYMDDPGCMVCHSTRVEKVVVTSGVVGKVTGVRCRECKKLAVKVTIRGEETKYYEARTV